MATIQVLQTLLTLFIFQLVVLIYPSLGSNLMITGNLLKEGQNLTYKEYSLTVQSDCNLVLYKNGNITIWETRTGGYGRGCYLTLSRKGKLTLYTSRKYDIWNSKTESQNGIYALVLRYDGTLHVYGPKLWTARRTSSEEPLSTIGEGFVAAAGSASAITDAVLYSGDVAPIGTTIVNGHSLLTLQTDCNLVLTFSKAIRWQSGVSEKVNLGDCYVNLEGNGELRVKHWGGDVRWTNGVKSSVYGDFVLALRSNADLGVYGPGIWSSSSESGVRKPSTDHEIQMVTDE